MITTTITIQNQTWMISGDDRPNPLAPTPRITATTAGVTVDINCRYRSITSVEHRDDCTWGVSLNPVCACAPHPADDGALFAAALDVLRQCRQVRDAAEAVAESERLARIARDEVYVLVPAGCEGCPSAVHGGVCTCDL
jgi:hypothetical protein